MRGQLAKLLTPLNLLLLLLRQPRQLAFPLLLRVPLDRIKLDRYVRLTSSCI